jgi:hypothetical protein
MERELVSSTGCSRLPDMVPKVLRSARRIGAVMSDRGVADVMSMSYGPLTSVGSPWSRQACKARSYVRSVDRR